MDERLMGPHGSQPVEHAGLPLAEARAAMLMVHGRNAAPANILTLAEALPHPAFAYVAPAAAGGTWYPYSFMAEKERNEPWLSSALARIGEVVDDIVARGVPRERIILLGFSQGACLASEFAARNAGRYGSVVAYSGGLIGPPGTVWEYDGSFEETPVFLGCSDVDAHVPKARVDESAAAFERMGARVTKRIYPGMGHLVNEDEIAFTRDLMREIAG
jgi:predicted esterase